MEPLSFEERLEALESLVGMVEAADRMAELGYADRSLEMYDDILDLFSLYRERVV